MAYRIAFVITDLDPGGAERQMVELVTRLPRGEFEPSVLVLFPQPRYGDLLKRLTTADVPVEFFNLTSKWKVSGTIRGLARRLKELQPKILQCFLHHANLAGCMAACGAGVQHVVTSIRVAERRWNLHRLTARMMDRGVTRHVCVSEAVANFAATSMGLSRSKLVVIPNGVEVAEFAGAPAVAETELGAPPGARVLLFIGRLDRQKRVDWLIRRIPDLTGRLPRHHLVVLGQGNMERRLKKVAHQLGVANCVHFVGWRSDVSNILAAADVLLLASAWEGMPNAVLEAMAAGKPVVSTQVEGVEELLGPLEEMPARQLVARNDSAGFVDAVTTFGENGALRDQVGLFNQERATSQFSYEKMVARYCDLYHGLK